MDSNNSQIDEKGFETYPAPPPYSISRAYADRAYSMGVQLPDGLIIADNLSDVTPEMLELRDRFMAQPSHLQRFGSRVLDFFRHSRED